MSIHPTAIIEPGASIGKDAKIGPYCVIGKEVRLGNNVILESHVVIAGKTTIGDECHIFPFASIGHRPQDLKYKGEPSTVTIGKKTVLREYVTVHPGTEGGGMKTTVGDNCLLMGGCHVAHDCRVGNNVIMANHASIAGHVEVGDFVIMGGLSAAHQFVRIGHHAMVGGMSAVESDVIPYGSAVGERASLAGLNIVGLKRRGFDRETIHQLRSAYRMLFSNEGTLEERVADTIEHFKSCDAVMEVVGFLNKETSRAICLPKDFSKAA